MYYDKFINQEFTDYLNRYCTGIVLLKDAIKEISVSFYFSEAYSNHSCRFSIDVDFFDYEHLPKESKIIVNKYFYNAGNSTGSRFVSFIYKSQSAYDIDFNEIKSFINHYSFAQNLFDGFIRNVIPNKCSLEIATLESEPFFNYISHFLYHIGDVKPIKSFSKRYFEINKRNFKFDCYYHKVLKEASTQTLNTENTVTDKELYETDGGDIADLRKFIVEEKIPFSIRSYSDIIEEIRIDASILKEKMKNYVPKNSYINIRPKSILNLIEKKEKNQNENEEKLKTRLKKAGLTVGDYICVKNHYNKEKQYIGIIKNISIGYNNDLRIEYNVLKTDLLESLSIKDTLDTDILYILKSEIFEQEKKKGTLKTKEQLVRLLKERGKKHSSKN
jgi:hypothetical protein